MFFRVGLRSIDGVFVLDGSSSILLFLDKSFLIFKTFQWMLWIMDSKRFRKVLLSWFSQNARDLPWRRTPDLYKTVVSEFMLQQTQVKTVLPYFERWLKNFPDFKTLARAPIAEVLQAWAGLGYYSRAHYLQALAQSFLKKPAQSYAELAQYKGVGPYTAAAIASIAFNEPIAVVDGNVIRVLARLYCQQAPFKTKDQAVHWAQPLAQSLLDLKAPGAFNEAMMELGAVICTKKSPQCNLCPVNLFCQAYQQKQVACCPQFEAPKRKKECINRLWLTNAQGALLLAPSRIGGRHSLLELPILSSEYMSLFPPLTSIFQGKRCVGQTDYVETIYRCKPSSGLGDYDIEQYFPKSHFYNKEELNTCALTGPHRRWIWKLYDTYVH